MTDQRYSRQVTDQRYSRALRRHLVAEPHAVRAARQEIVDTLELHGPVRARVALLVSELVSNAVLHGSGDAIELSADLDDGRVRVEVYDDGGGFEPPPPPREGEPVPAGWGLYLVSRLADRWGVDGGRRTRVWFEIDHHG